MLDGAYQRKLNEVLGEAKALREQFARLTRSFKELKAQLDLSHQKRPTKARSRHRQRAPNKRFTRHHDIS